LKAIVADGVSLRVQWDVLENRRRRSSGEGFTISNCVKSADISGGGRAGGLTKENVSLERKAG